MVPNEDPKGAMTVSANLELSRVPVVDTGMLIRRPAEDVFAAWVDPAITTRYWFSKSSGSLAPGAHVKWEWEIHGVSTDVSVKEFEQNRRLVFDWGPEDATTTVEVRFIPWHEQTTYVHVTESGLRGTGDEVVAKALDSTGGFTMVLCALKALLEHDVVLSVVADKAPAGLEL
jgi:uncharacterized protein YndB with AHSA1/START domain